VCCANGRRVALGSVQATQRAPPPTLVLRADHRHRIELHGAGDQGFCFGPTRSKGDGPVMCSQAGWAVSEIGQTMWVVVASLAAGMTSV
jgi:hypothetical protein